MQETGTDRAALVVRLLGDVEVSLDGRALGGFDTPRLQRLLAQLSLYDGGRDRARLAFELWPDSTDHQARTNLRKVLHDLRRQLPDPHRFVDLDGPRLRWRPGAAVSVDVLAFRRALAAGDLVGAARHYGGDLLPSCYDDWVLAERDRLRTAAIDALVRRAGEALDGADPPAAVESARRALQLDELCEPAHRALIEAHARGGDRAEALRAYRRCAELLRRELDVEPDATTRSLGRRLAATDPGDRAPATVVAARPSPVGAGPEVRPVALIGRGGELGAARAAWDAATAGGARLLLVSGEPGIGKSRLVEELARVLDAEGTRVAVARAYEGAGRPPWGPVVDWLRSPAVAAHLGELDPMWLAEVARLVPEVHAGRPDRARRTGRFVASPRHHLLDALSRALVAGGRPLAAVVDDLQWCDRDTIELIGFVLVAARDAPVLVAATLRDGYDDGALSALRERARATGTLVEVPLGNLDRRATGELAAAVGGRPLDPGEAEELWRGTEGNPLFVIEAARAGLRSGVASSPLTPTVEAVISARLAGLTRGARRVAEVAATVGRAFEPEVLAEATGTGEDDLVEPLDELWRRQIIRESDGGYDFTHDLIRAVVANQTSPARRRHLHRSVAGALARRHRDDLGPVARRLAAHHEEAGRLEDAVAMYRRAGRHAVAVFALEDAIDAYRRALELLARFPPTRWRDETEVELRIALGVPLIAREGYGSLAVREDYERALAACERLGRAPDAPVLRGLGLASVMSCAFDRSAAMGRLLVSDGHGDPVATTEGHYLLGVSAFWRGAVGDACRHLQTAVASFDAHRRADHLALFGQDPRAVCASRLALAELWAGRPGAAEEAADRALEEVASLDHPTTTAYVRSFLAMLAVERGDRTALGEHLAAGDPVWSEPRLDWFTTLAELFAAWLRALDGEPGAAAAIGAVADGWLERGQTLHVSYAWMLQARAATRAGDPAGARHAVGAALRWAADHDQHYLDAELWRLDGRLRRAAGDRRGARASLRRAAATARSQGAGWFEARAEASLARLDTDRR